MKFLIAVLLPASPFIPTSLFINCRFCQPPGLLHTPRLLFWPKFTNLPETQIFKGFIGSSSCKWQWWPAQIQDVFHIDDHFWAWKNRRPKSEKKNFCRRQVLFFKSSYTLLHCFYILSNLKSCYTWYFYSFYIHKLTLM